MAIAALCASFAAQCARPDEAVAQANGPSTRPKRRGTFWIGYMTDWVISRPWSLWFDSHYNHDAFFVLRGGLTFRFEAGPALTAGYAHLWTNPGDGSLKQDEHRPWGQVVFPMRFGDSWAFSQRIRYDARFREKTSDGRVSRGWFFTHRLRYQSALTYFMPKIGFGQLFLQTANEVLVHFGRNAGPNFLDQDRVSVLIGWRRKHISVRTGYMYRFLPGTAGNAPRHEHGMLLWINHSIDLFQDHRHGLPEANNP